MLRFWTALPFLALLLPAATLACSLCGSPIKKNTFGQDFDRAAFVFYGRVVDSRLAGPEAVPGSGSSDFEVHKVLKGTTTVSGPKKLELPGYIPVLDKKDPPQFVMFCDEVKGKVVVQGGREVRSPVVLEYLEKSQTARAGKDRTAILLFCARYLDHAEDAIAEDAFLEFAKSTDAEVGQAAQRLDPAFFRKLIENPKTPPERLGLFAFFLAGSKDEGQGDFLKSLLDRPTEAAQEAMDGILSGYIALRPREGWDRAAGLLADPKQSFKTRLNALRAVRFTHNCKPKESRPEVVRALGGMIEGDLSDMAIEDLRRWRIFDLSERIYKQYRRPEFDAPILRSSILRYALVARRDAEARAVAERFLKSLTPADQVIARDIAEGLELERKVP